MSFCSASSPATRYNSVTLLGCVSTSRNPSFVASSTRPSWRRTFTQFVAASSCVASNSKCGFKVLQCLVDATGAKMGQRNSKIGFGHGALFLILVLPWKRGIEFRFFLSAQRLPAVEKLPTLGFSSLVSQRLERGHKGRFGAGARAASRHERPLPPPQSPP